MNVENAGDLVRLAIAEAIGRVEARLRSLGGGLTGPDGELRREAVPELRAALEEIANALGWDKVLAAVAVAVEEVQAEHEGASDEAIAVMVAVVAEIVADLSRAPEDLARRLVRALDAALADGAKPGDVVDRLSGEAAAYLIAVGTDFATGLMGLHREGTLGEMAVGGVDLFVYDGPDDEVVRPFCAGLVGKVLTEEDLDELDNGQGLKPTSRYMGGYNCRHAPSPIPLEEAKALPPASVAGRRARRIVLEGAIGPKEAAFEVRHLGEVRNGQLVRRRPARSVMGPEKSPPWFARLEREQG